jgi:hypothetical protein
MPGSLAASINLPASGGATIRMQTATQVGSHPRGTLPAAPLSRGHDHIDFAAATAGTDQPFAPIEHGRFGAVPCSHLGGIGFDLMLATTR